MHKETARTVLFEIDKILNELNIRYFLTGGTLLGAIREGKIIECDTDMDLGCLDEEFRPKIKILVNAFKANDFTPVLLKRGYKGEIRGLNLNKTIDGHKVHCCLVSFRKHKGFRYYHYNAKGDAKVLPEKFINQCVFINFLGLKVRVPELAQDVLSYIYGDDWRIEQHIKVWVKQPLEIRYNLFIREAKGSDIFWWSK